MNIVEEPLSDYGKILRIKSVDYLGDWKLNLSFSDGKDVTVDFKHFLKKAQHPAINKYLDQKLFKSYKIENGNLNWNDYDLIFPIADLYEGKI